MQKQSYTQDQLKALTMAMAGQMMLGKFTCSILRSIHEHPLISLLFNGLPGPKEFTMKMSEGTYLVAQGLREHMGISLVDIFTAMNNHLPEVERAPAELFVDLAEDDERYFSEAVRSSDAAKA